MLLIPQSQYIDYILKIIYNYILLTHINPSVTTAKNHEKKKTIAEGI